MASSDSHVNYHQLSEGELYRIKMARWKARTDLTFLAQQILGYKDVIGPQRFPFINLLQKFPFPGNTIQDMEKYDKLNRAGRWVYQPVTPMYSLPGGRRVLILDPRGFLKTTINAQSHTIQWILNYPDIAMMVIQSNSEKAEAILGEIKRHFQANPAFRQLFPEHCPNKKVFDWGTKAQFVTEARGEEISRKESTLMTGSIDKGSAGYHFDVMKFSDIVEPNNVRTKEQIQSVIQSFGMFENLLVEPRSWIDVEGTRYSFSDLYEAIIKSTAKLSPEERELPTAYRIHVRGVYKKDLSSLPYKEPKFTPEELDLPYLLDENKKRISQWPERWPLEELEKRRKDPAIGDYIFACQQLNDPGAASGDALAFPVNEKEGFPAVISRENFYKNVRISHYTITVDTAETQTDRSDYTVMSVVGWDRYGRPYVVEVKRGKFLPDDIINNLFLLFERYTRYGNVLSIAIEETGYVRGFMPALNRKMELSNKYLPIKLIKRETSLAKKERILNTLQPWYINKELRFLEGLEEWEEVKEELRRFPTYIHDDILDSLADHFQGKEYFGRLQARQGHPWEGSEDQKMKTQGEIMARWMKVEPIDDDFAGFSVPAPGYHANLDRTGGL